MLRLEDLEIYQLSMTISDQIWKEVDSWDYFAKSTIGIQITRCADSVSANIAEGYGRGSLKQNKQFCLYSRGSLKETICFLNKSFNRKLINEESFNRLNSDIELLGKKLNSYIFYLQRVT